VVSSVTITALAFSITWLAFLGGFIGIMVLRAFIFALLAPLIVGALLAHLLVEPVPRASLAPRMALPANGFPRELPQRTLVLWSHILEIITGRTTFILV